MANDPRDPGDDDAGGTRGGRGEPPEDSDAVVGAAGTPPDDEDGPATEREVRDAFRNIAIRAAAVGVSYGSIAELLRPTRRSHAYAALDLLRDAVAAGQEMVSALDAIIDRVPQ